MKFRIIVTVESPDETKDYFDVEYVQSMIDEALCAQLPTYANHEVTVDDDGRSA